MSAMKSVWTTAVAGAGVFAVGFALASASAILSSGCGSACKDPAKAPTYTANVKRLVEKACLDCHSASSKDRDGAPSSENYDTYAELKKSGAEANGRVSNKTMPPTGSGSTLTEAERATFDQWVACGMKE